MTESAQKQSQVHKNAQIDNKKRIKVFDDRGTKAWADVPNATEWLEDLRGNDTPEVTMEVPCKTDLRAPHGFDRNASHSADRYVCECEGWEPVDAAYTKNDTTAGVLHKEWVDRLIRIMGTFDLATGHADTMDQALDSLEEELSDVLGYLRARREWVGLTDEDLSVCDEDGVLLARYWEAKLKEKNGG